MKPISIILLLARIFNIIDAQKQPGNTDKIPTAAPTEDWSYTPNDDDEGNKRPVRKPSISPTRSPVVTVAPTRYPTRTPIASVIQVTKLPTRFPVAQPVSPAPVFVAPVSPAPILPIVTVAPTMSLMTTAPTPPPTTSPTDDITNTPTFIVTSYAPSLSFTPSTIPSESPSYFPSTHFPSSSPTISTAPSSKPTQAPTPEPTFTAHPSVSQFPTAFPSLSFEPTARLQVNNLPNGTMTFRYLDMFIGNENAESIWEEETAIQIKSYLESDGQVLEVDVQINLKSQTLAGGRVSSSLRNNKRTSASDDGHRKLQKQNSALLFDTIILYRGGNPSYNLREAVLDAFRTNLSQHQYTERLRGRDPEIFGISSFMSLTVPDVSQGNASPINSATAPVNDDNDSLNLPLIIGCLAGGLLLISAMYYVYRSRTTSSKSLYKSGSQDETGNGCALENSKREYLNLDEKSTFSNDLPHLLDRNDGAPAAQDYRTNPVVDGEEGEPITENIIDTSYQQEEDLSTIGDPVYPNENIIPSKSFDDTTKGSRSEDDFDGIITLAKRDIYGDTATHAHDLQSMSATLGENTLGDNLWKLNSPSRGSSNNGSSPSRLSSSSASPLRKYLTGKTKEIRLTIDAPPGKLGLIIDDAVTTTPTEEDREENTTITVPIVHAIKDSSVLSKKVQVGDRFVEFNGIDTTDMPAKKLTQLVASRNSENRVFVVMREIPAN